MHFVVVVVGGGGGGCVCVFACSDPCLKKQ